VHERLDAALARREVVGDDQGLVHHRRRYRVARPRCADLGAAAVA
jgi:hypothetical protein